MKPRHNLIVAGEVPDLAAYLRAADLSLCPIEHGGGTKLKPLESLAAGLPSVVFPAALHGTRLKDGEHVRVVNNNERDLCLAIAELAADKGLRGQLAARARAYVEAHYNWETIAPKLEDALLKLMESTPQPVLPSSTS